MIARLRPNLVSSWLLLAAVSLAPLPFGSIDPPSIALWCIVLGAAAVFASTAGLDGRKLAVIWCALVLVVIYAVVLGEQLSSSPLVAPFPLWAEAAKLLDLPLKPVAAAARDQPFFALGASLAAMLALVSAFLVAADRDRAYQILIVLAWSAALYAVFGVASFLLEPGRLLWREKQVYLQSVTGTFVGRNAAADFFGMGAIVWLALLGERLRRLRPQMAWRDMPNRLLERMPADILVPLCALMACLVAMFMTGSRAGVVLSLMALIVAFAATFYRDLPTRGGVLLAVAAGGAIALVLLQLIGSGVSGRFSEQGLTDEGRFQTYQATARIVADYPILGTGLGTFPWVYPAYRPDEVSIWGVWDRAHNTLLEIAVEMGLPAAGAVTAGWLLALGLLAKGVLTRRRDRAPSIAAFSGALLALSHSMIDFSLQISGYAIPAFALIGCGLAQSFSSRRGVDNGTRHREPTVNTAE